MKKNAFGGRKKTFESLWIIKFSIKNPPSAEGRKRLNPCRIIKFSVKKNAFGGRKKTFESLRIIKFSMKKNAFGER